MTLQDRALDEFYINQMAYWLRIIDNAESEIEYWENKRKELRKVKYHK